MNHADRILVLIAAMLLSVFFWRFTTCAALCDTGRDKEGPRSHACAEYFGERP